MEDDAILRSVLGSARKELLDLSTRNRLLSTQRTSSRSGRLEIVDERSDEVFRHLVGEKKVMSFLPAKAEDKKDAGDEEGASDSEDAGDQETGNKENGESAEGLVLQPGEGLLLQPEDDEAEDGQLPARYTDTRLQTALTSEKLQRRLLALYYDAKTYEEEQGVNILYLALGFLKWYEDEKSDRARFAPLLLVPVRLDRQSATTKFKIRYTEDDVTTNLSLQARLREDFGIALPEVPDVEEIIPSRYFDEVAAATSGQSRWQVLADDVVLWFFSFSKFLMYRDLDPASWPEGLGLENHALIRAMLREGFRYEPPLCDDREPIDPLIAPIDMVHVLDADSSQAVAIEEVKRGRNLVIQGPPGTGKSQTIANLVAAAVKANKKVLFVAEKMAALEVVERRLANHGLGDLCLVLHSHKANKRIVLEELQRTLLLGRPQVEDVERRCQELYTCRERLNEHVRRIHAPLEPCGLTPFQIIGQLVRLRAAGTRVPEFKLEGALKWSHADYQAHLTLLRELVERVEEVGVPGQHAWRGVELDVVLPTDVDRILAQLPPIEARLERLRDAGTRLTTMLGSGISPPQTLMELSQLARMAQRFTAAPPMDRFSLASSAWQHKRQLIERLIEAGQQLAARRAQLADVVVEAGWDTDVAAARRDLAAWGRSWLRFFIPAYRGAQATLRGILVGLPPKKLEDRLSILDGLIQGQKARAHLTESLATQLGQEAFGSCWCGLESDWAALAAVSRWEAECRAGGIDPRFRAVFAGLDEADDFRPILEQIAADLKPVVEELQALVQTLRLKLLEAFGTNDLHAVSIEDLSSRFRQWRQQPEALSRWVSYHTCRARVRQKGMAALAEEIHAGTTAASEAVARCEMAYYEELIREAFRSQPELAAFHGASHEQVLQNFRQLDTARIVIARHEVALAHYEGLPTGGDRLGEVGVVRHEIQKKRRHLPIRLLLVKAGRAVQAIKPVFMMSPISVAQYLEPGAIDFDLLLIDEASQVQPVDALGAVARTRQIVVVGDSKQLPPTTFFRRMLDEDGQPADEQEEISAGDVESILGLCCAQNVPQRMLSWHYRSRHHSLIAVSNHEFYDDRLHVVPSPGQAGPGQGLLFRHVAEGVFDRGGSATNRVEAKVVAQAAMAHARQRPDKSLGIGAFSVSQRDAVLDELELLRRRDPSLEHFFATACAEPFFVKNLENIQGDERDVIFISVGYAKDSSGYMAMHFGPLSNHGGERRLNVLITRARECCTVFSSIRADDIDTERTQARGAHALKTFLKYAETGLLDTGIASGGQHGSEFEQQVARALAAAGYETHPQVGVAGFFIDLAVVDPRQPGRYLLGIECDGANYHRARWARDRDRLRQAVLEDRGWIMHRIWSTDWFHRPEEELKKAIAAIDAAKLEWAMRASGTCAQASDPPVQRVEIPRQDNSSGRGDDSGSIATQPYAEASFGVSSDREIHELAPAELAQVIARVIEIEGPIHREEIARRIVQLWGLHRTGNRIREAVDGALEVLARDPQWASDGPFFFAHIQTDAPIRDRSAVESSTLRKPEMLPPAEIRHALAAIVEAHVGVTADEAVMEAARVFGFRTTSSQLRQVIEQQVPPLLAAELLEQRNGKLYMCERNDSTST